MNSENVQNSVVSGGRQSDNSEREPESERSESILLIDYVEEISESYDHENKIND